MAEEANETKAGRKSTYTDALGELICDQIASGKTLKSICSLLDMPSERTVHRWLKDDDKTSFCLSYRESKLTQYDVLFDSILDISNDDSNDTAVKVNRARVKIDAIKHYTGKLHPAKYGDKPVEETVKKVRDYSKLTDKQLRELIELEKIMEDSTVDK